MKNLMYSIGITAFLACGIFNVTATLNNPFFGMSHIALAQGSGGGGSGDCFYVENGTVVISCGFKDGCCWKIYNYNPIDCRFTGSPMDYCSIYIWI